MANPIASEMETAHHPLMDRAGRLSSEVARPADCSSAVRLSWSPQSACRRLCAVPRAWAGAAARGGAEGSRGASGGGGAPRRWAVVERVAPSAAAARVRAARHSRAARAGGATGPVPAVPTALPAAEEPGAQLPAARLAEGATRVCGGAVGAPKPTAGPPMASYWRRMASPGSAPGAVPAGPVGAPRAGAAVLIPGPKRGRRRCTACRRAATLRLFAGDG